MLLLINKPKGITSHNVVDTVRRITGLRKVGHAGTLDPNATGLLIVGVGKESTRKLGDISKNTRKEYLAKISPETKRNGHPAPFPENLIYRLVKFYSYKGNTILDMFGGTGTVAVVAYKTKRHFIHIDISGEYNEVAQQRLNGQ